MDFLNQLKGEALRFLMPWCCAGCRCALSSVQDDGFCGQCWLSISRIQGLVCRSCGIPLKDGGAFCFICKHARFGILLRAATIYSGVMPNAIYRFKYAGRQTLAQPFSVLMDFAWRQTPEFQDADWLVPVPLHKNSERVRGYNQAALLARALSRRVKIPVWRDALVRSRPTTPQIRLLKDARRRNVQNAFRAGESEGQLRGKRIVLVDDVGTTGSTLSECGLVLRRAGAAHVAALVLARDL